MQGSAGHNFHRCQFLIRLLEEPPGGAASAAGIARHSYSCWRVPAHLQKLPWQELLGERAGQLSEQLLLLANSHVASVLAKLEEPRFIHCYSISTTLEDTAGNGHSITSHALAPMSTSSGSSSSQVLSCSSSSSAGSATITGGAGGEMAGGLLFELPRFGLEFELLQGVLVSRQYSGFTLGRQQQLVWQPDALAGGSTGAAAPPLHYTLPGLCQYLVLKKLQPVAAAAGAPAAQQQGRAAATLMLVPAGAVLPPWDGGVRVQVDSACGARVQVGVCAGFSAPSCPTQLPPFNQCMDYTSLQ
jgi:hypothetical protein